MADPFFAGSGICQLFIPTSLISAAAGFIRIVQYTGHPFKNYF
jgi:hypothetical protein